MIAISWLSGMDRAASKCKEFPIRYRANDDIIRLTSAIHAACIVSDFNFFAVCLLFVSFVYPIQFYREFFTKWTLSSEVLYYTYYE